MPGTTTRLALPYATPDDTTDPPRDLKALAEKVDSVMSIPEAGDMRFSARTAEHGNWIKADGRTLGPGQFVPLRDALIADGSPYGTDAGSPKLPDMRGRTPIGAGAGPGLTARSAGQQGGGESHVLTAAQMPSHSHTCGAGGAHAHAVTVSIKMGTGSPTGGGQFGIQSTGTYTTAGFFAGGAYTSGASDTEPAHAHAIGAAGSGQSHPNMPPFTVGTWFIYAG